MSPLADLILSPQSGRKHKAWGASPRIAIYKSNRARGAGDSATGNKLSPAFSHILILGLATQALCFRPLRGLRALDYISDGFAGSAAASINETKRWK